MLFYINGVIIYMHDYKNYDMNAKKKINSDIKMVIAISEKLLELIEKETEKKEITRTEFIRNLFKEYFLNKKSFQIKESLPMEQVKRRKISFRLPHKEASYFNTEAYNLKMYKVTFVEELIKKYFNNLR